MQIPNLGGRPVFKERLKLGSKGTRAGARVIYYCDAERIDRLFVYSKADTSDIPTDEIRRALTESGLLNESSDSKPV